MLPYFALSNMYSLKRKFFSEHTKERIFDYFDSPNEYL